MRTTITTHRSVFFKGGIPSNFYILDPPMELPCPIKPHKIDSFKSVEHYFHCCKVALADLESNPLIIDGQRVGSIRLYRLIRDADTCREAKRLGRLVPFTQEDCLQWDRLDALTSMLEGNLAKFSQDQRCRKWLLSTGERTLIERRPDPIWGDNLDGTGRNLLGLILEVVRARIRP